MLMDDFGTPDMADVGFVLLAGGTGSRMKANMREYPVAFHFSYKP
jgi:hypothetical protein